MCLKKKIKKKATRPVLPRKSQIVRRSLEDSKKTIREKLEKFGFLWNEQVSKKSLKEETGWDLLKYLEHRPTQPALRHPFQQHPRQLPFHQERPTPHPTQRLRPRWRDR